MRIKAGKWLSMSPAKRVKALQIVSRLQILEAVLQAHGVDPIELKATRKLFVEVLTA